MNMKPAFFSVARVLFGTLATLAVLSLSIAPSWAGSPFYLTVEKSYTTAEHPVVRLDFTRVNTPLELRVLRPRNVDSFLDGQFNISRAYEEPTSAINPAHYVLDGLNTVVSPLPLLQQTLSDRFKQAFGGTKFQNAIFTPAGVQLAPVPKEITQEPPAGFDIVRTAYVDLQKGGTQVEKSNWFWTDDERDLPYQVRSIELDPLPDGLYLVQGLQGKLEAQALLQVSSLNVEVKQSSQQLLVRAIDRQLNPVAGATVRYRDARGKWIDLPEKTDTAGELLSTNPNDLLDGRLLVQVRTPDGRTAITSTDFLPSLPPERSVFVLTDRPIFKPGETVSFKGIIRDSSNGQLQVPAASDTPAKISLLRGTTPGLDYSADAPLTPFGSFSGSVSLDPLAVPDLYRLTALVGSRTFAGEFRVRDYKAPLFYLDVYEKDSAIVPGQPFNFKLRARSYSGGIPKGVRYEVFVYRKLYDLPAFVLEAGGGVSADHDYFGQVQSATALTQPQRVYSSIDARQNPDEPRPISSWESAPVFDANGEATVKVDIPDLPDSTSRDWTYTLMVRAMDQTSSQAIATETYYATAAEALPQTAFETPIVQAGSPAPGVRLRTIYPNGDPAARGFGELRLTLEHPDGTREDLPAAKFSTDTLGEASVALGQPLPTGRLTAVAALYGLGERRFPAPALSPASVVLSIPEDAQPVLQNTELELFTQKTVLDPGEHVRVYALLPSQWGQNDRGQVWSTVAGTKIFSSSGAAFAGRTKVFDLEAKPEFGTGFYQTVTIPVGAKFQERTLGFRIAPKDKQLRIAVSPEAEIAEPLKPFVIRFHAQDSNGQPAAETELAVAVVNRAVYAVQGEFRPTIGEFFYPLTRLNVGTFLSDELQGYGYAAELRRPNFRLAALKPRNQPVKRAMRDTAGWFPHVVTDAQGNASVTVDMPANVTEWVVTAVAADKSGRIGEGRGRFRSAVDLNAEAQSPSFLRSGDRVEAKLEIQNQTAAEAKVSLSAATTDALKLTQPVNAERTLAANARDLVPISLEAPETAVPSAETPLLKVDLTAPAQLRAGGPREFELKLKPAALEKVYTADQTTQTAGTANVTLPVPSEGTAEEVRVLLTSSLLGAAYQAASRLTTYPYGCTEQLVHSTIPNLVMLGILKDAGLKPEQLSGLQLDRAFEQAKRNAAAGMEKLARNQKADGGFGLWPSDPDSIFPVTLLATSALSLADDLHIDGAERLLSGARRYLSDNLKSRDYTTRLGGWELAQLASLHYFYQLQDDYVAYLQNIAARHDAPLDEVLSALKIYQQVQEQWWISEKLPDKDAVHRTLVTAAKNQLAHFDSPVYFRAAAQDFSEFGFQFGYAALFSDAMGTLFRNAALTPADRSRYEHAILAVMRGGIWTSTYDTAQVVLNSRDLIKQEAEAFAARVSSAPAPAIRNSAGQSLGELRVLPGALAGTFPVRGAMPDFTSISVDGAQANDLLSIQVKALVPFRAVVPASQGIDVQHRLLKIAGPKAVELQPEDAIHTGDVVISETTISRQDQRFDGSPESTSVVLVDPLPSLAEGIDDDRPYLADAKLAAAQSTYWSKVKETYRYPDRIERIVHVAPGASLKVYSVWRAAFSGKAVIPPVQAFDMYNEAVSGNAAPGAIEVR